MIITIDGPNSSGKGTLAFKLADFYGFKHFDTGMVYRAVGLKMMLEGISPDDEKSAEKIAQTITYEQILKLSQNPEFRGPEINKNYVAVVAAYPKVREYLLKMQRDFAVNNKNVIYDGRDTGTVICPDADIKLYITASAEIRAERRYKFYRHQGIEVSYEEILKDVIARDEKDMNRLTAPLKPAEDAIILDTSNLNIEQAFVKACEIIEPYII